MAQPPAQPRAYSQAYLPNGGPNITGPVPGARPLEPNQGRVLPVGHARVLCVADIRGSLRQLNDLARSAKADYIIHTGDFGFYDESSLDRIAEKTLKHVAQYSPLLPDNVKADISRAGPQSSVKERFQRERLPLSELPSFLNKTYKLDVPVFTVWGACEDVSVLEKLRSGEYKIDNLVVIDESHSRLLDVGGVKLRLLGLGGAVVMHKMFDNGEGRTTIAGGQGTMWTTLLQIGELIDTATRVYDPTETRILVTHASPAREGLLNQLSVSLKADFSISAGLHFRYGSSYNEFSVNPSVDHYRGKLSASKAQFNDVWETVKREVEPAVSENEAQHKLLGHALDLVEKMPSVSSGGNPFGGAPPNGQVDESAFKNMWNFNLADAAFGWLVLDIDQGRIGTEMRAQGFNFSHRGTKAPQKPVTAPVPSSNNGPLPPSAAVTPGPGQSTPLPSHSSRTTPQPAQQQPSAPRAQPSAVGKPNTPVAAPKSATPQPLPASNPANASGQANGSDSMKPAEVTPANKQAAQPSSPQQEPSKAIFITNMYNVNSADEVKAALFSPEDAAKVVNMEKTTKGPWIAHFDSSEVMQEVLKRSPPKEALEKYKGLRLAVFQSRGPRGGLNAGTWGGRGGAAQRGGTEGRGGYQSAGGATTGSDSETGRGGRGGRGRGSYRGGERGRGRGGRGGERGGKSDGNQSAAPGPAAGGGDA